MVKANAYGHGDIEVALRLEQEGVQTMGVGLIEEGLLLRQMGVRAELIVFGIFEKTGAIEMLHHKLTPVISVWSQIQALEEALLTVRDCKLPIDLHIKFDTGMHRLGFDWLEAKRLFEYFQQKKSIFKVKGILTHLHSGDDASSKTGHSYEQLRKFTEVEAIFSPMKPVSHTLNSAGLLNFIKLKGSAFPTLLPGISLNQGARPGLSLYGYSPLSENIKGVSLKPVMSLRSHIVRYHQISSGDGVSYSHTWHSRRKTIIGIVPIGYADGYHRALSNKAEVLFLGERAPVVGNVCMDYLSVDVTDALLRAGVSSINEAENMPAEVTLFGYDSNGNCLPATELAQKSMTIPWEILTSVGERVPRVYISNSDEKNKTQRKTEGEFLND
jgi:alanine racemase